MAKFLNGIDLGQTPLNNAVIQVLSAAPSSPKLGQIYYDSGLLQKLTWNGSAWENYATNSQLLVGQAPAYYLARGNQTGTQTSSTISDLAAVVKAYTLDTFAAPVANVNFNGYNITGLADPTTAQQAATKNYVDVNIQAAAAGIQSKVPVTCVSVVNISTLSGLPTCDGITMTAGQRILLTGQTTASQNGPYVVGSGAWTRPTDDGTNGELTTGALWFVSQGTAYAKTQWIMSTTGTITVGTTNITVNQYSAGALYTASNGVALTGNNFAIALLSGTGLTGPGLLAGSTGLTIDTTVVARKYAAAIGDGSTTSIVVTHNLGTVDVVVTVKDTSGNVVYPDIAATTANSVTITFANAPASNAYRVVVIG